MSRLPERCRNAATLNERQPCPDETLISQAMKATGNFQVTEAPHCNHADDTTVRAALLRIFSVNKKNCSSRATSCHKEEHDRVCFLVSGSSAPHHKPRLRPVCLSAQSHLVRCFQQRHPLLSPVSFCVFFLASFRLIKESSTS